MATTPATCRGAKACDGLSRIFATAARCRTPFRFFRTEAWFVRLVCNPVEQLIQSDLRARGIELTIATRDMGALLSSARTNAPGHCAVYTGVAGDPGRSQLAALFDPAAAGGALEFGAIRPQSLTAAFAQLRATTDTASRGVRWESVYAALDDSVPATPVFHSRGVQGLSRRLQHVTIDLRGELYSAARWTLAPVPQ